MLRYICIFSYCIYDVTYGFVGCHECSCWGGSLLYGGGLTRSFIVDVTVVMADRHTTNSRPNSITISASLFLKGGNVCDNIRVSVIELISKEVCISHVIKFVECYNEKALASQITQFRHQIRRVNI
jgi:hypothetical protein